MHSTEACLPGADVLPQAAPPAAPQPLQVARLQVAIAVLTQHLLTDLCQASSSSPSFLPYMSTTSSVTLSFYHTALPTTPHATR
jgi:hypothetical protein